MILNEMMTRLLRLLFHPHPHMHLNCHVNLNRSNRCRNHRNRGTLHLYSLLHRRAKAEDKSRQKALLEREKKGLLTDAEKMKLAEERALERRKDRTSEDKDKCCIM